MKKWVHAKEDAVKRDRISILEGIDHVDLIVVTNDARTQRLTDLPVKASTEYEEDYDQFTVEELMDLDDSILRKIESFYALDNINTAIRSHELDYKLTKRQIKLLSDYYRKRELAEVCPTDEELAHMLHMIAECTHIVGPQYRPRQPEKNFAEMHGLKMVDDDYFNIIKSILPSEFYGAVKSYETERLGAVLYEFVHDPKGYKLEYSGQSLTEDLKIYIKLLSEYEKDLTLAIVSFHDPEGIE